MRILTDNQTENIKRNQWQRGIHNNTLFNFNGIVANMSFKCNER